MKILIDEEYWDWPSTSWADDHHGEVDALIKENRQITVSKIALTLQRGVTDTARHRVNITCRGVTSTGRHAARSHSFVYISTN